MTNLELLCDEFRNILAILVAGLVLALPSVGRRDKFPLRLLLSVVVCLVVVAWYLLLRDVIRSGIPTVAVYVISIAWYSAVLFLAGGAIAFCFHVNFTELVWFMLSAYAIQHIAYIAVYECLFYGLLANNVPFWVQMVVYILFSVTFDFFIWVWFRPQFKNKGRLYVPHSAKNSLVLLLFLAFFLASTFINQHNAFADYVSINWLSAASDFINCFFVLVVQFIALRNYRINSEKETVTALFENEKKQYEAFKKAVDYVNYKCHDLKHELLLLERKGKLNEPFVEEAMRDVAVYEAFINTDNETLNLLLTDKNITCVADGISFSSMIDNGVLKNMTETDIYALLGNLLDNAIESVSKEKDKEKRFIRLFIRKQGGISIIHQENYFEKELTFVNGLPKSTKGDDARHGFGMKSMRRIAESYGGSLRTVVADGMFKIDIIIPDKK